MPAARYLRFQSQGKQHEEAFKADFDPSGGLVGHWGLLGAAVKKMCNPRNLSPDTAYTSKHKRGASSTALAPQVTKEGGGICLTRL